jgi:hypothetical protein
MKTAQIKKPSVSLEIPENEPIEDAEKDLDALSKNS